MKSSYIIHGYNRMNGKTWLLRVIARTEKEARHKARNVRDFCPINYKP